MKRIYSVHINGRTLESWDLRELLARAVNAKRRSNCRSRMQDRSCKRIAPDNAAECCVPIESAMVQ